VNVGGHEQLQGTGNRDQGTGNRDQGSGNREQGSGIREQGSGIRDQGTGNRKQYPVISVAVEKVGSENLVQRNDRRLVEFSR
jgi:hypothetical protein